MKLSVSLVAPDSKETSCGDDNFRACLQLNADILLLSVLSAKSSGNKLVPQSPVQRGEDESGGVGPE